MGGRRDHSEVKVKVKVKVLRCGCGYLPGSRVTGSTGLLRRAITIRPTAKNYLRDDRLGPDTSPLPHVGGRL